MAANMALQFLMFASAFAFPGQLLQHRSQGFDAAHHNPHPLRRSTAYASPAWTTEGQSLEPKLSQQKTNGNSLLGTLQAPRLPEYLSNPDSSKVKRDHPNWGKGQNFGINDVPKTGVTRHYSFVATEQDIAPDGVVRSGMVFNGGYPGPTIEANWGDHIQITVQNNLPNEGLSVHWHGLLQHETPYMDGVPGTQQCPIAPGGNFTYTFLADLYGTSFYHYHYSAQYTGGLYGAIVIYGPHDNAAYDEDIGPVFLNDWYHTSYYDTLEQAMAPISAKLPPPQSNNNLINGKMNYPCQNATGLQCTPNAGISKFNFESGKSYRMRLINAGAEGMQKFSIDGYQLQVIANDFVPLKPYFTDVVTLGIGQRTDIVVTASGKSGDAVWMRSTLGKDALQFADGCTNNDGVSPEAVAAIYYEDADTSSVPNTTSTVPESKIQFCQNDDLSLTVPYYSMTPETNPTEQVINLTFASNGTNYLFYMNNSTFRADYNDPVLLEAKLGQTEFAPELNVYSTGNDTSYRVIIYNYALTGAHPMHLHGHNYYVLAQGTGEWDGQITNAQNPQRRDVQLLPVAEGNATTQVVTAPSYIVLQFEMNNPGVWPLHCHIAWHVSAGLYVSILESPSEIQQLDIPPIMAQTCRDWSAWTGHDIPDQIDSGL